jgi:hypothetical protein
MDEFCGIVVLFVVVGLATLGAVHLATDYRYFDDVVEHCQKLGYIQNETTRIECKVEGK